MAGQHRAPDPSHPRRLAQAAGLRPILLSQTATPGRVSPLFKSLLKTDPGDVTASEAALPRASDSLSPAAHLLPDGARKLAGLE